MLNGVEKIFLFRMQSHCARKKRGDISVMRQRMLKSLL
jgi:hypothetical protein